MQNLIYFKKQMYYLLSNLPEKDRTNNEEDLLAILEEDTELQAELIYTEYINGE